MDDLELLNRYSGERDQRAFAELLGRHLDWVYSAALRQVRDEHLAEDVAQAVFLALSQKAATLARGVKLPAWLFEVTRCASRTAIRSGMRRREHEKQAAMMALEAGESLSEERWEELAPMLDELVGKLRERDRMAVLLRFYQGRSMAEVAVGMGTSEEAAKKRVARAVEKLKRMFDGRGMSVTTGALGVGMGAYTTETAPAGLMTTIAAGTAKATMAAAAITKGAVNIMAWAKVLKTSIVVLVLLGVGAVSLVIAQKTNQTDPTANSAAARDVAAPAPAPVPAAAPAPATAPATQGDDWQARFFELYRLEPGQLIKFIPEPFIPERESYWLARLSRIAAARGNPPPEQRRAPGRMVFLLKDSDQAGFGGLYIPQRRPGLRNLLRDIRISLPPPEVVVDSQFDDITLTGDWIIRADDGRWLVRKTPVPDAMWRGLERILKEQTGRSIRFEKRTVDLEYVVARGRFQFNALDPERDDGIVYLFADGAGRGEQPLESTIQHLLETTARLTGHPFIDETEPPAARVRWKTHTDRVIGEGFVAATTQAADPAPAKGTEGTAAERLEKLLADLSRQTSLEFHKEKRQAEVIMAVEDAPTSRPSTAPSRMGG